MTSKKKLLILIPLLAVAGLLIYCRAIILTTDIIATWRHYAGLGFFLILFVFFNKSDRLIIATGIYLLLATFNLLAMTPAIATFHIVIGPILIPPFQSLSPGLFVLYFILNNDAIINMYFDHNEKKRPGYTEEKK